MEHATYSKPRFQTASSSMETLLDVVDDDVGGNEAETDNSSRTMAELLLDDQVSAVVQRLTLKRVTDDDLVALYEGWTILSLAAAEGHERIVQLILETTPYRKIPEYATDPMIQAVSRDQVSIVQLLWTAIPGQVDVKDGEASLLHIAAREYAHTVLQWLLPRFPTVDPIDGEGQTPLHLSVQTNNDRGTNLLLRAGASVNLANALGNTALHMAIASVGDEDDCREYVQLFLTANADVNIKNGDGMRAAELTEVAAIQHLLANEAVFRAQFPLHCMARANDVVAFDAWLAKQPVDEAQRKANVATALSVQDMDGLTVVMHATKAINNTKPNQVLNQLLPYCSPDTLQIPAPNGETVLDLLLQAKALEGVMVCLDHELDPTTLPDALLYAKPPLACFGACRETRRSGAINYIQSAESKNWNELQSLLKSNGSAATINDCDDKGYAVLHHVCKEGSVSTLQVLLQQTRLDINLETENDETMSALALAAANQRIKCVRLLLLAGADLNVDEDVDDLGTGKDPPDYYLARLPNIDAAKKCIQSKQTALHAAMRVQLPEDVLDDIADNVDLDAPDDAGETALMVASKLGHLQNVRFLIEKEVDIDCCDKTGRSALMLAAVAGHGDVAEYLVNHLADIVLIDKNGATVLDQLATFCRGQPPSKDGCRDSPQAQILEMLLKEAQTRATSQAYRDKVALSMVTQTTDEVFGGDGAKFGNAIQCSSKLGQTFLDDFITLSRHEATFSKLDVLYGSCAEKGALDTVLSMTSTDADAVFETKKTCLEHIAFRRLLEIKWELFAQRKYIEQLLMNVLLLLTMTTSSVLFTDERPPLLVLIFGISAVTLVAVAYAVVQDVSLVIPDLPRKKAMVRHSLMLLTTGLTLACVLPLLMFADALGMDTWFACFNNGVLGLTALYFVVNEAQEMKADLRGYLASTMNKAQLLIYLLIVTVFVPMKMEWVAVSFQVQVGVGGFLTLALWVLSLQFLEVVPSASFLLPMMADILADIWNFSSSLASFKSLFRRKSDEAFGSLAQSFMTTYFVAFGQVPLSSLDAFNDASDVYSDIMYTATALLMMLHSAIVVVVLLNVLLAMMNKTVDGGLNKAKTQALISYAQCIFRIEGAMALDENETKAVIHLGTNKRGDLVLNPIFAERISKAQLELSVEQADALMATASLRAAWYQQMQTLDAVVDKKMDLVRDGLLHIDHFVALNIRAAFGDELKALESSRKQIKDAIETARRSRGEYKNDILARLRRRTKKELEKLKRNMTGLWKPKATGKGWDDHAKGVLLYELTQRSSIAAQLEVTSDSIQTAVNDPAKVQIEEDDDDNDGDDYSEAEDDDDAPENGMAQLKRETAALKVANEAQAKQLETMTSKLDAVTTKLDVIVALLGHRADATESMRRQNRFDVDLGFRLCTKV
ncbi:hypothetical protein SPRG_22130 [Saprolegnia parasitica CBS 223.65]|uniref:Uncharacterized protein n=1 Tax=Saprolegnia parasitica (strain CBS 223.65) TaxID=695850 RepID=A0A067CK82_SAPPC|nr:hypothetical protein SPRG_22130 [Saprolegnia parasitica CBS 223.65]KDO31144.1 hypothetical protein SPRG_22130 [Saprolegnia parasitica CBS 223.65]|eukprot:XP_012198359.1 hypothetical protein SPRG_22130 [Saprolegnia parasitica CBS 223.65]